MIRISNDTHNKLINYRFKHDELMSIYDWFDPIITNIMNNNSNRLIDIRNILVDLFTKAPNNSITKIFLYQLLLMNGIIDDGIHSKERCSLKQDCAILNHAKEVYGINDYRQICFNMKLCFFVPGLININLHERNSESLIEIPKKIN